ncbi:Lsr2 family protein [Umezawaea sp.]|uniref:histone-like nucleoid-structuring protein Lsr2 n=1 Tax=Umezawaea sp. TaxID=1955258 RepID=UPI002ED4F943
MVRKVVGEPGGSSGDGFTAVRFGLDGVEFVIDLAPADAARLREFLGRYAVCARSVLREAEPVDPTVHPSPVRSRDVEELRAVRSWARGRGFSVSDRGRLPEAVLSAYDEAHPTARKGPATPRPKIWN